MTLHNVLKLNFVTAEFEFEKENGDEYVSK